MKKTCLAAVAAFAIVAGCQPVVVTTPAPAPPNSDKNSNIHIEGPRGGKVDIKTKGDGDKVDVNVNRSGTAR